MVQKPLIKQGYSLAEEIANSVSHGIGLVFGIVGLVLLLVQAVDLNASATAITSYSLYGGSMILLFLAHRFKILSLVTYLAMGWLSLVVIYEMAVKLAAGSVTLLAVGGVVYSLGVIFYVCKRIPYNHAIWHGFVLGGSVCHFLAIYLYIGQA